MLFNIIDLLDHLDQSRERREGVGIGLDENGAFWVEIRCSQGPQVKNAVSRMQTLLQPIRLRMWREGRGRDARFSFH